MKVRLKVNTILNGKFVPVGTIVDDRELTERLRNNSVISRLDDRSQAMIMRELNLNVTSED